MRWICIKFILSKKSSAIRPPIHSFKMSPMSRMINFHLNNFHQGAHCGKHEEVFFLREKIFAVRTQNSFSSVWHGSSLLSTIYNFVSGNWLALRARQLKASIMNYLLLAYSKWLTISIRYALRSCCAGWKWKKSIYVWQWQRVAWHAHFYLSRFC